ncbi:MAG: hypothetical protein ACRDFX_03890, partial [Chloroflexota bacterium]
MFVLLLVLVPSFRSSTTTVAATSASPPGSFALQTQGNGEVASLATQNSSTVAQNGHYVTTVSTHSLNYRGGSGWPPINDSLVPAAAAGFAYQNQANRYTVSLPPTLASPVRVSSGSAWAQFSLAGGSGTGTVSGATDTFPLPHGSLRLAAQSDAVKESITLAGPGAPSSYRFALQLSPGFTAQQNTAGGIDLLDGQGAVAFSLAPPSMTDQASATHGVAMSLEQDSTGYTVALQGDQSWLADPARSWPVVIDPTMLLPGTTQDCSITGGGYANQHYCGGLLLKVGYDGYSRP